MRFRCQELMLKPALLCQAYGVGTVILNGRKSMLADIMTTLDIAVLSFIFGYAFRPVTERLWKKLNDKFDEWSDV